MAAPQDRDEQGEATASETVAAAPSGAGRLTLGAVLALTDQLAALSHPGDTAPTGGPGRAGDAHQADRNGDTGDTGAAASGPRLRHLALGLTVAASDQAARAGRLLGSAASIATPPLDRLTNVGPMAPLRRRIERSLTELADRGRLEEEQSRETARLAFHQTVGSVAGSPVVDDVVNDVVGRVIDPILDMALPKALDDLGRQPELMVPLVESIVGAVLQPILDSALPLVMSDLQSNPDLILPLVQSIVAEALDPILELALPQVMGNIAEQPELIMPLVQSIVDEALEPLLRDAMPKVVAVLNEDPDAIRSLVAAQSTGIAVEMTDTVRVRAASADERIDRIVRRVLRRQPQTLPPVHVDRPAIGAAPPDDDDVIDVAETDPSTAADAS